MYYHRDVCIGNVYMPSVKRKKKGKKDNVSGLAKLKLTRNTRGSYEHEVLNSETSITHSSFPLVIVIVILCNDYYILRMGYIVSLCY